MSLPLSARAVVGAFTVSGVVHLVKPEVFEPIMPSWVPAHRPLIHASGVAELLCAAGLMAPSTRKVSGYASAALLVAVYPGNVEMARRALRTRNRRFQAIALARLPLQVPMIRGVLRAAREA